MCGLERMCKLWRRGRAGGKDTHVMGWGCIGGYIYYILSRGSLGKVVREVKVRSLLFIEGT